MTTATITFEDERVGRNHNVAPITVEFANPDDLAHQVHAAVRKHLLSRHVEVVVDLDEGKGNAYAGFRPVAAFRVEVAE